MAKKNYSFQLDFSIELATDRLNAVKQFDLEKFSKSDLELITNYVLYGKDANGTSSVDRKEIEIKTKYNSYKKENLVASLDDLMENPAFDEGRLQAKKPPYKKPKAQLDLDKANTIPEYRALRTEIDHLQDVYDVSVGKKQLEGIKPLSSADTYKLKHQLIAMKTSQYELVDAFFPHIGTQPNRLKYHPSAAEGQLNYKVYPRGVVSMENDKIFGNPRLDKSVACAASAIPQANEIYFDFRNKEHLYYLVGYYDEIKDSVRDTPDSPLWNLLWTLDFYIEKANLSPQQQLIVDDKKHGLMNKEIRQHLIDELGISHQENYISTIWSKAIELIIAAVEFNYDEWLSKGYDKAWKKCNRCGRELLKDPRNFVRKAKAYDGLTSRCKCCDRELRQLSKLNK